MARAFRLAIAGLFLTGIVAHAAGQRGAQKPCESSGSLTPLPPLELITIAQCQDSRWEFAAAERTLSAAIVGLESQIGTAAGEITTGPVFVGGEVATPQLAKKVTPGEYPKEALARNIVGTVIVGVTAKADGSIGEATVVDSIPELDAAALATVKKMRFERTLIAGKPVEVSFFVPARFGLAADTTAGDWMILARSYASHGHPAAAAQVLGQALAMERADLERFGPAIVRAGQQATPPRQIRKVDPRYPPEALSAKAQGMVIIEALIDLQGKVGRAHVLKSAPGFDSAALDAVSGWTYEPVTVNGARASCILVVTVSFSVR